MIKVGLVTSWGDHCGIAQYAQHLVQYAKADDIQIQLIPVSLAGCIDSVHFSGMDIIHMNESGYTMAGFGPRVVEEIKRHGKKTLLTFHTSNPVSNHNGLTDLFDKVVVHEPNATDGFAYIPQGCPVFEYQPKAVVFPPTVGTCGFPLAHKNTLRLAEATKHLDYRFMLLAPVSGHVDVERVKADVLTVNPNANVITKWHSDAEILELLSSCDTTCFPYTSSVPGPSAAVGAGLAVRRQLVVSRCNQMEHLFPYEDEITFIDSANPSVEQIEESLVRAVVRSVSNMPGPVKAYEAHRWDNVGRAYCELYRSMFT